MDFYLRNFWEDFILLPLISTQRKGSVLRFSLHDLKKYFQGAISFPSFKRKDRRGRQLLKFIIIFICLSGYSLDEIQAKSRKKSARKESKRTTVISFEDELIQGDISSPDLFVILKNKNINFGRLLKLRKDFIPEMKRTKQDVHGSFD